MSKKIDARAFALSAAILAAFIMLVLGLFGNLKIYNSGVQSMMDWHVFFNLTPLGIIAGMIEAFVSTFIGCYVFIWLYNKLL